MRTENRKMREKRNYVLTVEGETEQWYFQWLKDQINKNDTRLFDVSMTISVQQKPSSYWKNVNKKSTPKSFIYAMWRAKVKVILKSLKLFLRR